jgi:hypothetical protein
MTKRTNNHFGSQKLNGTLKKQIDKFEAFERKMVNFKVLGSNIQKNLQTCITKIEKEINEAKRKNKH